MPDRPEPVPGSPPRGAMVGDPPLTVDGSRFCQFSCFQEALIPVLRTFSGLADYPYERLRLLTWAQAARAMRAGKLPGVAGGLHASRMRRLFSITWRVPTTGGAPDAAIEDLLRVGPAVVHVDRSLLPTDARWHRRAGRIHAILVIGHEDGRITYLDGDHPVLPARLPADELNVAARGPAVRGHSGPLGVAAAAAPDPATEAMLDREFHRQAAALLSTPGRVVDGMLRRCLHAVLLAADDPATAATTGLDPVAYLNGVGRSVDTARDAFGEPALGAVVTAVDIACRRLMLVLQRSTPERGRTAEAAVDAVAHAWSRIEGRWT